MTTPRELKELYLRGENISGFLRRERGVVENTSEIIEVSYDLQTGSYIRGMQNERLADYRSRFSAELARIINGLCAPQSILEAGIGEGTTLSGVLRDLAPSVRSFGFDISWSRVAYAEGWLRGQGAPGVTLFTGDLFHIPIADDAVDLVYTVHAIEPNGGREQAIIAELFRVARDFVVLLEPGYDLADEEARRRMESHGYCRDILGACSALGLEVLEHRLFPHIANPLNPTALTVIRKPKAGPRPDKVLACPRFKTPLEKVGGMFFSPEALVVYPVVAGIPCLRIENGILASKYPEIVEARRHSPNAAGE